MGKVIIDTLGCCIFLFNVSFASAGNLLNNNEKGNLILLDETATICKWRGVTASSENIRFGKYSALWNNHTKNRSILMDDFPHDWSRYSGLSFWLYSEVANNATIFLTLTSQDIASGGDTFYRGWSYYCLTKGIKIDWTGWKKFEMSRNDFESVRRPVGWNKIDKVIFHADRGSFKPKSDTILYLDRLELVGYVKEVASIKVDAEPNRIYTFSILKKGGPMHIDVDWLDSNGSTMQGKTSFIFLTNNQPDKYENFTNIAIVSPFAGVTAANISLAKADDTEFKELSFFEDRTFKARPAEDVSRDCNKMKQRFQSLYNMSGLPADAAVVFKTTAGKEIDDKIQKLMDTQIINAKAWNFGSWGQVKDIQSQEISYNGSYFGKPFLMACAYVCSLSKFHNNPELLRRIEAALNFGKQFIRCGGPRPDNWWAWDIGIPINLSATLLLVGDKLNKSLYNELVADLYNLGYHPVLMGFLNTTYATGANATWVGRWTLNLGILENDERLLRFAQNTFLKNNTFTLDGGDGIQPDGSYHFHGKGLNLCYGFSHLIDTAAYIYLTAGTDYSLKEDSLVAYLKFFKDFAVWDVYRGRVSPYTLGRSISRKNVIFWDAAAIAGLYLLASDIDEVKQPALATIIDRENGHNKSVAFHNSSTSYLYTKVRNKLTNNASNLIGMKFYPYSDYFVARTKDFYCAVRMSSTRTKGWFAFDGENLQGYYSGEGTLVLMTDGQEYMPDTIITQPWDDLSGITRTVGIYPPCESIGESTFVGGVVLDSIGGCGMKYLVTKGQAILQAKKSYFVAGDVIVMLGSDIKATNNPGPTETMILTLPTAKDINDYYLDGKKYQFCDGSKNVSDMKYFFCRNIGIIPVDGQNLVMKCETRTRHNSCINKQAVFQDPQEYTRRFFSIQSCHGKNPSNGEYGAIILPASTLDKTAEAAKNPPVRIVQKDDKIHAIEKSDSSCAAGVFFDAGECKIGGLDKPGYLAWEKNGSNVNVAVFTPEAGEVTVKLPFAIDIKKLPPSVKCKVTNKNYSEITITADAKIQSILHLSLEPIPKTWASQKSSNFAG